MGPQAFVGRSQNRDLVPPILHLLVDLSHPGNRIISLVPGVGRCDYQYTLWSCHDLGFYDAIEFDKFEFENESGTGRRQEFSGKNFFELFDSGESKVVPSVV